MCLSNRKHPQRNTATAEGGGGGFNNKMMQGKKTRTNDANTKMHYAACNLLSYCIMHL